MAWHMLTFENAPPHICSDATLDAVLHDLTERGVRFTREEEPFVEWSIDRGGACFADRPWEDFAFGGSTLSIASDMVASFILGISQLQMRTHVGVNFFKLKTPWTFVCLSPAERDELLELLRQRVQAAEARASAFYADKKPMSELIKEVNAQAHGVSVAEMPDLGGHHDDRFHRRKRGAS